MMRKGTPPFFRPISSLALIAGIAYAASAGVPPPPPPWVDPPPPCANTPTDPASCPTCPVDSSVGAGGAAGGGPGGGAGGVGGGGECKSCPKPVNLMHGPSVGDPVDLATGVETYRAPADIDVYNPYGPDVVYRRTFHSGRALDGYGSPGLSTGWTDNYDVQAQWDSEEESFSLIWPDGAVEVFDREYVGGQPTGYWLGPDGAPYIAKADTTSHSWIRVYFKDDGYWSLTPAEDSETFRLSAITDRSGGTISIVRNDDGGDGMRIQRIEGGGTALLTFTYDGNGYLDTILDAYGRSVSYETAQNYWLYAVTQLWTSATPPSRAEYTYVPLSGLPLLSTMTVPNPADSGDLSSTATINYDGEGKVTSLVDANGNRRLYTYETYDPNTTSYGTKVEVQRLDGANYVTVQEWIARWDVDDTNHLNLSTGRTDASGHYTLLAYGTDDPRKPETVQDESGLITRYKYDRFGNVLRVTPPCDTETVATVYEYEYDTFEMGGSPLGRLTAVRQGFFDGNDDFTLSRTVAEYSHLANGLVENVTMPGPTGSGESTVTTHFTYNARGDVLTETVAYGTDKAIVTTYTYDATPKKGQPLTVTVGSGGTTVTTNMRYDSQGNLTKSWDASGNDTYRYTGVSYNVANQPLQVTEPGESQGTARPYRLNTYLYPGGPTTKVETYDGSSGTPFRQVLYGLGPEGELLSVTGSTEPVSYVYDALYRKVELRDGRYSTTQKATLYEYNDDGRLETVKYPNWDDDPRHDLVEYTYEINGRLHERSDGRDTDGNNTPVISTYSYTDCGFLTEIAYSGGASGSVSFEPDEYGRRVSMTDAQGTTTYTYDDADNIHEVEVDYVENGGPSAKTLTYAYWPNGQRQTMTLDGVGDFDYTYDVAGRMTELANPNSEHSYWTYGTNGLLSRQTLGNGAYAQHYYNARGLLTQLLNRTSGGSPRAEFVGPSGYNSDMTYDAAGNRLQFQVPQYSPYSGTVTFSYDTKDRLTYVVSSRNGSPDLAFAYDDGFNPTTFRSVSGLSYNDDNQRLAAGYGFDGNGNPTTYGTYGLTFDAENRMTQYGTALYAGYSGDGLRAWKDTDSNAANGRTYFLYDGGVLLAEMDKDGNLTAVNTWGANGLLSRRVGSTTTYYAYDPQGSVAVRLNAAQSQVTADLYDAYGSLLAGGASDPYGYCGQWGYYKDSETGKTLCTFRYYDPSAGRSLTRDPIGYRGGINLYGYVRNGPVDRLDPSGLDVVYCIDSRRGTPCMEACAAAWSAAVAQCVRNYDRAKWWRWIPYVGTHTSGGILRICMDKAYAAYLTCVMNCPD